MNVSIKDEWVRRMNDECVQNVIDEWVRRSNAWTIDVSTTHERIERMEMCNAWDEGREIVHEWLL